MIGKHQTWCLHICLGIFGRDKAYDKREQLRELNVLRLLIRGHEHTINEMKEKNKCNRPDISRREQMELRMR